MWEESAELRLVGLFFCSFPVIDAPVLSLCRDGATSHASKIIEKSKSSPWTQRMFLLAVTSTLRSTDAVVFSDEESRGVPDTEVRIRFLASRDGRRQHRQTHGTGTSLLSRGSSFNDKPRAIRQASLEFWNSASGRDSFGGAAGEFSQHGDQETGPD